MQLNKTLINVETLTIGAAIRTLRTASGLNQKQLADRVSVDPTYISHLESDRREPSLALLRAIARAINVPPGLILSVALWTGLPQEAKDLYRKIIWELIETSATAQRVIVDSRDSEAESG